jgi:hypothetical protein
MRYTGVIALCSESHTKHINSACVQKLKFMNAKPGGKSSNHFSFMHYVPYFYCFTVHFLNSLIITHQQMHCYILY